MREPEIHFDMMFGEYEQHKALLHRLDRESGEYIRDRIAALQNLYGSGPTQWQTRDPTDHELFALSDNFNSVWTFLLCYLTLVRGEMTLEEMSADDEIMKYVNAIMPSPQGVMLYGNLMWHTCQWIHSKRPVFQVTPTAVQRLQALRLQGLTLGDLVAPFRSFYVMLPKGLRDLGIWAGDTFYPLRGVYLTCDYPCWHIAAIGQWSQRPVQVGPGRVVPGCWDDHVSWWGMMGDEDRPLYEAAFDQTTGAALSMFRLDNDNPYRDESIRELALWVANLVAYLSDANLRRETRYLDPEVAKLEARLHRHPKGRKRERVKEELRGRSRQRVIVVGADLKPLPPGENGNGRPLEVRQRVRGHKRRVCVGPGRQGRLEKKIAPYWRGPDDGEESSSQYMLR